MISPSSGDATGAWTAPDCGIAKTRCGLVGGVSPVRRCGAVQRSISARKSVLLQLVCSPAGFLAGHEANGPLWVSYCLKHIRVGGVARTAGAL